MHGVDDEYVLSKFDESLVMKEDDGAWTSCGEKPIGVCE